MNTDNAQPPDRARAAPEPDPTGPHQQAPARLRRPGSFFRLATVAGVVLAAVIISLTIRPASAPEPQVAEIVSTPTPTPPSLTTPAPKATVTPEACEQPTSTPTPSPTPTATPEPSPTALPPRAQAASWSIDQAVQRSIARGEFPGAVVLVARDGEILKHSAYGNAVVFAGQNQRLSQPVPAQPDTIYDLASVTKVFTAVAVMRLVDQGLVSLDKPVADYIPEFAANGKQSVTVRHLLNHTSGLAAGMTVSYGRPTMEQRWAAVLATRLQAQPGQRYVYSDLGLIALGVLVERVSGVGLDEFISREITQPLGMHDTAFNPPAEWKDRIAATEVQPPSGRGVLHGTVHDPNAWALGGVAGHAGLFSSARDLAVFGQMMINGGELNGVRILESESVKAMTARQRTVSQSIARGLGWELNQPWYMGRLASPSCFGHTGYTGTSLVIDPDTRTVVVLLTNRLHPRDLKAHLAEVRRQVASLGFELADAVK